MNETTKSFNQELINQQEFFPDTTIFSTVDGEITDIINIKDSFNRLPKKEKLKIVSVLLEFCAAETSKLTKPIELPSDEEVVVNACKNPIAHDFMNDRQIGFIKGAKWMKEQVLNQNK